MPNGSLNRACVPVPSVLPEKPAAPATVVTTRDGVILRIVWFPVSATYKLSLASIATAEGELNRAPLPMPSAEPVCDGDPANVVTTPVGVILRIVFAVSATNVLPPESTATPQGK